MSKAIENVASIWQVRTLDKTCMDHSLSHSPYSNLSVVYMTRGTHSCSPNNNVVALRSHSLSLYNLMFLLEDLCKDGDMRLEGGVREYEGRIEICYKREWGAVCNVGINSSVAEVVCRQFGFSLHGKA